MMKNFTKLFALVAVMFGFSLGASAQIASASAITSATIITPISIDWESDLNFGTIAVQASTGGTVTLAPLFTAGRTIGGDGGVTLPSFSSGTVSAASFIVNGQEDYTYEITLPSSVIISETGGQNMTVDAILSTPDATGALALGTQTVYVGATLNVLAGQAAGSYTNPTGLVVTVNYN